MIKDPMSVEELRALPASVPLKLACRALGIGITKGYDLAKRGEFPVPLFPVGNSKYHAPRSAILRHIGVLDEPERKRDAA